MSQATHPGTPAFASQLRREYELIRSDLAEMREVARGRAASSGSTYAAEYNMVCDSKVGQTIARDLAAYNQRAAQHNEALRRARQAALNQRVAAKTQAAACGSCFTVHAGDCY